MSAQLSPTLSPPFAGQVPRVGLPRKDPDGAPSPLHAQLAQKTRMRTSFDPELELPKLQKWFQENQHPSRQQVIFQFARFFNRFLKSSHYFLVVSV